MKQLIPVTLTINDAQGVDEDRYITPCHPDGGEWKLVKAVLVPNTTTAVNGTNYRTVTLKNGSAILGSLTTNSSGGAAFTAATPSAFALSGGADLEFAANEDPLHIESTHTGGTGAAVTGVVQLSFERLA
ncbi:MAG: hypothetical protein AAFR76_01515 [Planctomycetota bacterium]